MSGLILIPLWYFSVIFSHIWVTRLGSGEVESTLIRGGSLYEPIGSHSKTSTWTTMLFFCLLKKYGHFLCFPPLANLTLWGLYSLDTFLTSFCNSMKVIVVLSPYAPTFLTVPTSFALDNTAHFPSLARFLSLVKVQNQIRSKQSCYYLFISLEEECWSEQFLWSLWFGEMCV